MIFLSTRSIVRARARRAAAFCKRHPALLGGAAVAAVPLSLASESVATTVVPAAPVATKLVASGFTSLQNDLLTYLGYAAALVVAVAGVAIGISMLIHWARRGAHA